MDSKEELQKLLEIVEAKTGKTRQQIAIDMGYGWNYLSDMLGPSKKVSPKFVETFREKHSEYLVNTNLKKSAKSKVKSEVKDEQAEYKTETNNMGNDPMAQALADMAASAREQAEANNKQAAANEINAQKELKLIQMMERKFNSNVFVERLSAAEANFDAFQEYLYELLKEKIPEKSIEELRSVLGKRTAEKLQLL